MQKYCTDCGYKISKDSNFCENCGSQINQDVNTQEENVLIVLPKTQVRPGVSNFDLYITKKRIIAAKVGTIAYNLIAMDYLKTRADRKKYEGLKPDEILNSHNKNFSWDINNDIESIKIKKHIGITRLTVKLSPALGHKTKYLVFSNNYFENLRVVLWQIAGNKITGDIGNNPTQTVSSV